MIAEISSVNLAEAYRYMGISGEPGPAVMAAAERCEALLLGAIRPRYVYRVFTIRRGGDELLLDGCNLRLTGYDIRRHLDGCTKAALLGATLSSGADTLIRRLQAGDMLDGMAADAIASAAIEQVCDIACREIKASFPDYYHTWRFSPGYGDLPLELQRAFLDVIDAPRKIGLCAEESMLLTPTKSVTAVIGLSENEIDRKRRSCDDCRIKESCAFRRKGERCGF